MSEIYDQLEYKSNKFSLREFYYVNFCSRPSELKSLVESKKNYIISKKDADSVIKAYRLYQGYIFLGCVLSVFNFCVLIKLNSHFNLFLKKRIAAALLGFSPYGCFYVYSHFAYWETIKQVVENTRKNYNLIEKQLFQEMQNADDNESHQVKKSEYENFFKENLKFYNYINRHISAFSCITEVIKPSKLSKL